MAHLGAIKPMYDFVFEYRREGLDGDTNRGFFLSLIDEALREHGLCPKVRQEAHGEWVRLHLLLSCHSEGASESRSDSEKTLDSKAQATLQSTSQAMPQSTPQTAPQATLPHASQSRLDSEAPTQNLDSTKEQILSFAQSLSHTLPLSLEFRFVELCKVEASESSHSEAFHNLAAIIPPFAPSTHYYTPYQTSLILSPQSEHFGSLNLPASHLHAPLEGAPLEYFTQTLARLKSGECVSFDTSRGVCELSLTPLARDQSPQAPALAHLIMCDIASLKSYFRIHQAQIAALASFEKPLSYLAPKEVFTSLFARDTYGLVLVGLPFDMPLALLCALGLNEGEGEGEGIEYLYIRYASESSPDSEFHTFKHTPMPPPKILTIPQPHANASPRAAYERANTLLDHAKSPSLAQGCEILRGILQGAQKDSQAQNPTQNLAQSPTRNLPQSPHAPHRKGLLISLGSTEPSAFYIIEADRTRALLEVSFESNPALVCEMIARQYESGGELLESFARTHPGLYKRLEAHHKTPMPSTNLLDIFGTIGFLLGLDSENALDSEARLDFAQGEAGTALLAHAYGYVRGRGPRIDYKLMRDEGGLKLDMARIVRSSLSFKCADMENVILCFGVVDSLCEFVGSLMRDTFINHGITDVLLQGDLLTHSFVLDKMLDYRPKEVALHLPQRL